MNDYQKLNKPLLEKIARYPHHFNMDEWLEDEDHWPKKLRLPFYLALDQKEKKIAAARIRHLIQTGE